MKSEVKERYNKGTKEDKREINAEIREREI
jgi:hypothetical protein